MATVNGILETALYVDDPQRAANFYQSLFGFEPVLVADRLIALSVKPSQVLLLFKKKASLNLQPGPHDGDGQLHLAFAIDANQMDDWRARLNENGIAIEEDRDWELGGHSLYFVIWTGIYLKWAAREYGPTIELAHWIGGSMNTNRTALITGASRGLGLALARELARRGWQLIIDARGEGTLRQVAKELAALTPVIAISGDVTEPAHRRALAIAARSLNGLDAVINNAGILGPSPQPNLLDYPLDVLEKVYRANVIAPLGVLQAVRDALKPNARILNITSDAGVEAYPGWGGYGSSKAAFEQLSNVLAAENPSLRVYWVDPGDMRTQMHQEAFPNEDINDRPLPEASVPGLIALLEGDFPGGRYKAREVGAKSESNPVVEMQT